MCRPIVSCNVPTHEFIEHCLFAAAGECACPAHAADECIHRRVWQESDAAFRRITLDTCSASSPRHVDRHKCCQLIVRLSQVFRDVRLRLLHCIVAQFVCDSWETCPCVGDDWAGKSLCQAGANSSNHGLFNGGFSAGVTDRFFSRASIRRAAADVR